MECDLLCCAMRQCVTYRDPERHADNVYGASKRATRGRDNRDACPH
jgi:hypothetical protein